MESEDILLVHNKDNDEKQKKFEEMIKDCTNNKFLIRKMVNLLVLNCCNSDRIYAGIRKIGDDYVMVANFKDKNGKLFFIPVKNVIEYVIKTFYNSLEDDKKNIDINIEYEYEKSGESFFFIDENYHNHIGVFEELFAKLLNQINDEYGSEYLGFDGVFFYLANHMKLSTKFEYDNSSIFDNLHETETGWIKYNFPNPNDENNIQYNYHFDIVKSPIDYEKQKILAEKIITIINNCQNKRDKRKIIDFLARTLNNKAKTTFNKLNSQEKSNIEIQMIEDEELNIIYIGILGKKNMPMNTLITNGLDEDNITNIKEIIEKTDQFKYCPFCTSIPSTMCGFEPAKKESKKYEFNNKIESNFNIVDDDLIAKAFNGKLQEGNNIDGVITGNELKKDIDSFVKRFKIKDNGWIVRTEIERKCRKLLNIANEIKTDIGDNNMNNQQKENILNSLKSINQIRGWKFTCSDNV